ncbi:MAG: RNA polymerase factor sigma-54, partial [Syntrophales bacterium]|nr:RNA polymerase factor sigma-54 [Syntrophales bacterium]
FEEPEGPEPLEGIDATEGTDRETALQNLERPGELTGEGDGKDEFDWNSYLEDYGPVGANYDHRDSENPSWDNVLTSLPSLSDHLTWQLKLSRLTADEMRVGEQIIGNLDPNGYLAVTLEELAELLSLDVPFIETVLRKIQEFDPPGIAARNLQECLLIQAKVVDPSNQALEAIIRDHLKDLEKKNYVNITRKLKIPLAEVLRLVGMISSMDPKPGSVFNQERVQPIVPDVYVVKQGSDYKVVLNEDGMPRLRINNLYKEVMGGLKKGAKAEEGKQYVRERVQSATWLIKSIEQRQKTVEKVAQSIVEYQRDFFDRGINYLKPLVLKQVADDVEMHESTISRVSTNKYMLTPRGIFELKYFFSSSIQTVNGEDIASKSVKEKIRKIISEEDGQKPLSDQDIVKRLKAAGITIARRTVAKYREMLGILPSSRRKKVILPS